ncbi:MAG: response regulator [Planctomycetia bacterium]|nr:response regulator [Planctomycetia bacterium]
MSQTPTILLVEDDPDLRDTLDLLLHQHGYHVIATGNGLRALELAEEHHPDVALVDLLVPGQSGFQVTLALKENYGDRVRVLVMSGNVSQAHQDYAFASGAEHFLAKPFSPEQLLEAIESVCPMPEKASGSGVRRVVRIGS